MFCIHCGKELMENTTYCTYCGKSMDPPDIQKYQEQSEKDISLKNDIPSIGLKILSFILPLVGLILWCVYSNKSPIKAKSIGKSALIGFIVGIVINIIIIMIE